ncbi:hypothetical protein [Chromatium okenii]|uniref:Uncharacterized protein n=1 Tax=Chromatium okenii TaxID=61644 RepID=A0A2S7XRT6_9GAMM|nr:hypothetical protein [Chromatium okenii]MBK1642827.1 hypothetical protein [Chromatium okenii]PQJ96142.1 hypothetical protein CXB77_10055 [Chromatium okenii]
MKFVVCFQKEELGDITGDDLTLGRCYEVIDEPDAHGMLRVIDDSGEDYLYPTALFAPVDMAPAIAVRLHTALAA